MVAKLEWLVLVILSTKYSTMFTRWMVTKWSILQTIAVLGIWLSGIVSVTTILSKNQRFGVVTLAGIDNSNSQLCCEFDFVDLLRTK